MSNVAALYHIVFCTKRREMTLPLEHREDLYRYIWSQVKMHHSTLLRIGGIENHVHMLVNLHPSVALSTLMRDVKAKSSGWLTVDPRFPDFKGWAGEYYACTIAPDAKSAVIDYIKGQVAHHHGSTFEKEFEVLHRAAGIVPHPDDMVE